MRFAAHAAIFAATYAVISSCALLALRSGLPTPSKLVLLCGSVIILAGALYGYLRERPVSRALPAPVTACLGSLFVVLSPLAAHIVGPVLFDLYPFAAALFLVLVVWKARPNLERGALSAVGLAVLSFIYLFWSTNNQGVQSPYSPEQMVLGLLNRDTTFHTAIAHMIIGQGHASLGLDGALPLTYHVASHYWFAALALLSGTEPIYAYMAGVDIVLVPLLLLSLVVCADACAPGKRSFSMLGSLALAFLFAADWMGWGLIVGASRFDPYSWSSYYISESYTLGLVALLLVLPLLSEQVRESSKKPFVLFGLAVLAVPLLTALKISIGFLWGVAWVYVFLRQYGLRLRGTGAACVMAAATGLVLAWLMPGTGEYLPPTQSLIVPFYFIRFYPEVATLSSLVLPLCYVALAVRKAWQPADTIRSVVLSRRALFGELVLILTIAASAPAMLGIPQESAVWYFMNVGQWFALPALLAELALPRAKELFGRAWTSDLGIVALFVGGFILLMRIDMVSRPSFMKAGGDVLRALDERSSGQVLKGNLATSYFRTSVRSEHRLFGSAALEALKRSPGAEVKRLVDALPEDKKQLAVFVPPTNLEFWKLTPTCYTRWHLLPAITGVPLLFGAPPKELHCEDQPYTRNYGPTPYSRSIGDDELCRHALGRAVQYVYVLEDVRQKDANRVLSCLEK